MKHAWRAAGFILPSAEEEDPEAATQSCHYCCETCETGILSGEAVWLCIWCHAVAHTRCYLDAHPLPPSQKPRSIRAPLDGASDDGDENHTDVEGNSDYEMHSVADDGGSPMGRTFSGMRYWKGIPADRWPGLGAETGPQAEVGSLSKTGKLGDRHNVTAAAGVRRSYERRLSGASSIDSVEDRPLQDHDGLAAALEPITEQVPVRSIVRVLSDLLLGPQNSNAGANFAHAPLHALPRVSSPAEVEVLDICSMGAHGKVVLPAVAVKRKQDATWSARAKSLVYSSGKVPTQQLRTQRWFGMQQDTQWDHYSIGEVPSGHRPVLVFINTKSGPQQGNALRRKFLRLLNPLQVVELPREKPEQALQLFADVPGLRLLVVGGDGTVGWVLACVDRLSEQKKAAALKRRKHAEEQQKTAEAERKAAQEKREAAAKAAKKAEEEKRKLAAEENGGGEGEDGSDEATAGGNGGGDEGKVPPPMDEGETSESAAEGTSYIEAEEVWKEPPIAILPLGTGNDLARVLNWGGSLGAALKGGGLQELLQAVLHSTPALFDRWDVRIQPKEQPKQLRRVAALAGARTPAAEDTPAKAMNNYLGIGIDAKVALEFHRLRENYPSWFQSQFGNKLIYTGAGAADIVLSSRLNLPDSIQVECDGEPIQLPKDIEGILLLNIPSYMGGVDLWASGHAADGHARHRTWPEHDDNARQSFSDKRLELVAVYGSWHLGQLQVGLSQARRLCRCSHARISTTKNLPMQVDGEPWQQAAAVLDIQFKGQALMLRRLAGVPLVRMAAAVAEVLDSAHAAGTINAHQRDQLSADIAARLHNAL